MTGVIVEALLCVAAAAYATLRVERARVARDAPPTYKPRHAHRT
jgi:hypothetical protein